MRAQKYLGWAFTLALLTMTLGGVGCALSRLSSDETLAPPMPLGGSGLCPALPPPTGSTVSVSSEAELRDQAYSAAPGTTILVAAGTYNLQNIVHVVHDDITIRSATGNRDDVILDAGGMGSGLTHAILIEADDVTLADLTIRNAGEHGVSINGSDRPTLYNLHILDTGYQLVKVNPVGDGSEDGLLACSRLEYTTAAPDEYTNGISAHNAHSWTVRDNAWYRIRTPGNTPVPTILFWSASSDTVVERNLLVDCYQGIAFGNASHGSGDHSGGVVRNNFIYASQPHDVVIEMVHATGWLVAHNTALLLNPNGVTWGMEARFSDTQGTFAYNLTNMDIKPGLDGAQGTGTGNVTNAQFAWFVNPAGGDLHLLASATAAIDRAAPLAQVTHDFDDDARPIGSAPDVGADEYSPPPEWTSWVYLPLVMRDKSAPTPAPSGDLIRPEDLVYQGAFRLPGGDVRPQTFAYGGNAMTFNPNGDPAGADDGFPGSLFVTGHDRLAYGELPDGSQVAEISIPVPVVAEDLSALPQAAFLQGFQDVAEGLFTEMEELPRIGIEYLDTPATGPRIHLAWGQHFEPDPPVATHAWFDPHLSAPDVQGTWFLGDQSFYSVNGYLFEIPAAWADQHAQGRYLATGRFRDGGWSGMGPALFAYRPWMDEAGTPAPSGTHLAETVLLLYESSENTSNIERCLDGYQHPDEWEGGTWITTGSGKTAVLFAGTKGTGAKYWYGFVNPAGPEHPCVEEEMVGQFTLCRLADGTPCPAEDLSECAGHNDYRGWWSSRFDARFMLYDPADLARVAAGELASWEPQPYASLDIDEYLFLNPAGVEGDMLGTGVQRRHRIGAVAYDRNNGRLYVLELFADEARPVVHVWGVQ